VLGAGWDVTWIATAMLFYSLWNIFFFFTNCCCTGMPPTRRYLESKWQKWADEILIKVDYSEWKRIQNILKHVHSAECVSFSIHYLKYYIELMKHFLHWRILSLKPSKQNDVMPGLIFFLNSLLHCAEGYSTRSSHLKGGHICLTFK
jgi:hypothetical protein